MLSKRSVLSFEQRSVQFLVAICVFVATLSPAPAQNDVKEGTQDYTELRDRGEYRAALKVLEAMIEAHEYTIPTRWVVDRAELRYETGQIDKAIEDYESLENRFFSPGNMLRLAMLYKERGRDEDYQRMLGRSLERARQAFQYSSDPEYVLVQGKIAELQGVNPKTILNSLYTVLMERAPYYAPGFIAAGDLAFSKWDYSLAAEYYEKALKVEEDNQQALAGLAECYWKSSDSRLKEPLERLLEQNPNHPRGRAIQAEMALDAGNTAEALEIIDEALAINPNRMRMLALQSAAWFLRDNPRSMAAVQERAFKISPKASEVFRIPGRIASRHYRFREGAELQRKALEVDPNDYRARAYYGMDLMRLGRDAEGRSQLEQAFEADRYNVVVFNMLNLLDSLKRFETIEHGPFELQLPKNEAPILAEEALVMLDEAYDRYTKKYKIDPAKPIRVQVFDNHDDFMVRSVGLPGTVGFLGICFGELVTMDSPSARTKWSSNWKSVLWHEFVHVITLQKTDNRMPRWLSEGISVYEETERDSAWGQRLDVEYREITDEEPLPGLSELEGYFTNPKTSTHLMFGYLTASEFVRFYVNEYGVDALVQALDYIKTGDTAVEALSKAAAGSEKELNAAFRPHIEKRLAPLKNVPSPKSILAQFPDLPDDGASITLARAESTSTSSAFTDAMTSASKAIKAADWAAAEAALKKAYELFPDYSGENAPLPQLIKLYERLGRRDDLLATLRKQISRDSTDFRSCRKLVDLLEEDKEWLEVAQVAETAFGIDPFDVGMRRAALDGYIKTDEKAKALRTLNQMTQLDPAHSADYKLQRVELLCELDRWDEAKREALRLLEEKPYFWEAQEQLLRIVERNSENLVSQATGSPRSEAESSTRE